MKSPFTKEDFENFEQDMKEFSEKAENEIGEIIKNHLIVEYYLNICVGACYPELREKNEIRLSFFEKIHILPGWCFGFPWIKAGVLELNRIRNKAAHNIHYTLDPADMKEMRQTVEVHRKMEKNTGELDNLGVIREISRLASIALYGWAKKINKLSKHGVGAYRWLEQERQLPEGF